jgi:hypothetical protein
MAYWVLLSWAVVVAAVLVLPWWAAASAPALA